MPNTMRPTADTVPTASSYAADDMRTVMLNRVSWGAILAGAVTALVIQLVLAMIGIGFGLSTVSAASLSDNPTAGTLSLGAGLWWAFSGIFASAAGGYLAGRLSGKPLETTAGYHGLTAWAVTTLVVMYLLSSAAGALIGGAFNTVGTALGGAGQVIGGAAQTAARAAAPSLPQLNNPLEALQRQVRDASGGQDPAALRDAAASAVSAAVSGDPAKRAEAEDRAANALARAQNIPVDQAKQQVQGYQQQYQQAVAQAKEQAQRAAEATRKAAAQGALYAALALILGALAAFFCGRAGTVDPVPHRRYDA